MLSSIHLIYKINKEDKNILQSIYLLVGQSARYDFRKISSKIMLLTILIIYTILSNDIYSIIVNSKYYKDELVIDNVADLAKSELPIYTSEPLKLVYSENSDKTYKNIDKKIKGTDDCISKLVNSKNIICIVESVDAKIAVKKYRNPDGSPVMYIATTQNCDEFFYIFEPASPYMIRFTNIMRRVHASGIMRIAILLYFGIKTRIEEFVIPDMMVENISNKLSTITLIGSLCASFAFVVEFLVVKKLNT